MPQVYALAFELTPASGYPADDALIATLTEWVRHKCPDAPALTMADPFVVRTKDNSILRWEPYLSSKGTLADFEWRHPHIDNPLITWSTLVSYLSLTDTLALSVRVSNTGPPIGSPNTLLTGRPRLLLHLTEFFAVRCDGNRYTQEARIMPADELPYFVRYDLFDPVRRDPILVLSPDDDGNTLVPPNALAGDFLSLARVFVIDSPRSTFILSDELGSRALSCYHGAARVYLPGLTRRGDPTKHPLLLPSRIRVQRSRYRMAQRLALLTTSRFAEDEQLAAARMDLRLDRDLAYADVRRTLVRTLEETRHKATERADYEELSGLLQKENDLLRTESETFRERAAELEERVRWLEGEKRALLHALEHGGAVSATQAPELDTSDLESVEDVVETAREMYVESLLFLPHALESAQDSPYKYPERVQTLLRTIADIAERRQQEDGLGTGLREAFREAGVDYRPRIAGTTPKKLKRQYQFAADDGTVYECVEHVGLGGGTYDPKECLRIYFNSKVSEDGKFVIGHVGKHLDVITTT